MLYEVITMENLAANAERDSVKYMQVKFMQDHKDEEFFVITSYSIHYTKLYDTLSLIYLEAKNSKSSLF